MKPTTWMCHKCRKPKKLRTEIARTDMYAVCFDCQRGHAPATPPDAPAQATVTVHRRGYVRRHGADNRDID